MKSVSSISYRNSAVALEMSSEIWNQLAGRNHEDLVVGWYHSHPNLGAFFSGTDRKTQKAFFNHAYSLGWVIDPIKKEQKVFVAGESIEYGHPIMVLEHGLALA